MNAVEIGPLLKQKFLAIPVTLLTASKCWIAVYSKQYFCLELISMVLSL